MVRRLVPASPLVNFEPVDPEPSVIEQSPAIVGVRDGVEPDIAEARFAFADDDRRSVDQDSVDQILVEKSCRGRRSALYQQVVDVMKPEHIARISQDFPAVDRLATS